MLLTLINDSKFAAVITQATTKPNGPQMCCNITAIDLRLKSYSLFVFFRQISYGHTYITYINRTALTVLTVTPVLLRSSEEDWSYRRHLRKTGVTVETVKACDIFL